MAEVSADVGSNKWRLAESAWLQAAGGGTVAEHAKATPPAATLEGAKVAKEVISLVDDGATVQPSSAAKSNLKRKHAAFDDANAEADHVTTKRRMFAEPGQTYEDMSNNNVLHKNDKSTADKSKSNGDVHKPSSSSIKSGNYRLKYLYRLSDFFI